MADPDSMHNAELQCCEWHPQSTVAVFSSLSANEHDVIYTQVPVGICGLGQTSTSESFKPD